MPQIPPFHTPPVSLKRKLPHPNLKPFILLLFLFPSPLASMNLPLSSEPCQLYPSFQCSTTALDPPISSMTKNPESDREFSIDGQRSNSQYHLPSWQLLFGWKQGPYIPKDLPGPL